MFMVSRSFAIVVLVALGACSFKAADQPLPYGDAASLVVTSASAKHSPCAIISTLTSPLKGTVTVRRAFGELISPSKGARYSYTGVDFDYAAKRPVLAANAGTARFYSKFADYGRTIIITGGDGIQTLYAGFSAIKLHLKGGRARVAAGQILAVSAGPALRHPRATLTRLQLGRIRVGQETQRPPLPLASCRQTWPCMFASTVFGLMA
jgi:hypothetical protein